MKKQTAAVMSAVTLISSVVPVAPVSAMKNQEVFEEIVEQTTEQVEGPIASSEILQEGNGIILEEAEIVNEEIKEDAVNTELPEEITDDINVESNEGEKIEVEDEEVFEEETVENMEELPSNEVIEDVTETENEMPESSTTENTEELPSNEVTEDVIETENELTESTTEENTEETIKVEQEIETTIQSGNVTENSQEGEKTQESITDEQEEVKIPDAVLKGLINETLGRSSDLAHPITKSELEGITTLYYYAGDQESDKVTDLTGLEYATNLMELSLIDNEISDLTPLTNLKKLEDLYLSGNQISDIKVLLELGSLTGLALADNPIKDITVVSNLTQLDYLDLSQSDISNIEFLKGLTNLTALELNSNNISDISPLEGLINLNYLGLAYNEISDIGIISKLSNLEILDISGNKVSDFKIFEDSSIGIVAPHQNIQLESVYIPIGTDVVIDNPIIGLDFKNFEDEDSTIALDVENGYYDTQNNVFVWENVTSTQLQFTFTNQKYGGSRVGVIHGTVTVPVQFIGEVEEVVNIPDAELQALINEALGRSEDPTHPVTNFEMQSITELNGAWRGISNLDGLEYATELSYLDLSGNQISDLEPLKSLANLKSLAIGWSSISDITPLMSLVNLTSLDLSCTSISNLEPLTNLINLKTLDLSYNTELSDLGPLSNLINLTDLYILDGNIENLEPLSNLVNLNYLYLAGNEVSDLKPLSNLTKLEELDLGNMAFGGNQISDITPLSGLTSLKVLSLGFNQISDISPLSKLSNLSFLTLMGNKINDLTPLDGIKSLELLGLEFQEIILDPVHIQRGETVAIDNPLVGKWWNMKSGETSIYDNGFKVENGYYDAEKNQFIFENVTTDTLTFSFNNYPITNFTRQYQGSTDGTVTIPVIFYEVSENFTDFVTNDIFNIIGGTGKLDNPLVLEVVEGTDVETIKSLLAKYNDYDLSVTKETTDTEFESYVLTFTKGEEKAIFKVQVSVTETEWISYLNSLITQSEPEEPEDEPTQPENELENKPNVEKPTIQENNSTTQRPQTGLSGLLGFVGISTLALGAVFSKRKKK